MVDLIRTRSQKLHIRQCYTQFVSPLTPLSTLYITVQDFARLYEISYSSLVAGGNWSLLFTHGQRFTVLGADDTHVYIYQQNGATGFYRVERATGTLSSRLFSVIQCQVNGSLYDAELKTIFYFDGRCDIRAYNVETETDSAIASTNGTPFTMGYDPIAQKIVYDRQNSTNIYILDADGSNHAFLCSKTANTDTWPGRLLLDYGEDRLFFYGAQQDKIYSVDLTTNTPTVISNHGATSSGLTGCIDYARKKLIVSIATDLLRVMDYDGGNVIEVNHPGIDSGEDTLVGI